MRSLPRTLAAQPRDLILRHWEQGPGGGYAAQPYDDGGGIMTIGWGHRISISDRIIPPLDAAGAERLLAADIDVAAIWADAHVPADAPPAFFDAVVLLAFNAGIGKLDRAPHTLAAIRSGDTLQFARMVLQWRFQKGRPLAGLIRRRAEEVTHAFGRTPAAVLAVRETLGGLSSSAVIAMKPLHLLSLAAGRTLTGERP